MKYVDERSGLKEEGNKEDTIYKEAVDGSITIVPFGEEDEINEGEENILD